MLVPKSLTTLRSYDRSQFSADVVAGVIVGIVALPLAIAFAIASGVTPDRGLYTAIIAGFLISALGGSRVQIGGPTGAFVVIVYGIVQRFGIDGLIVATLMAGVILIVLGVARMGAAIKFIPHPVVVGFTSGIAIIIFSSQVKDFLGLKVANLPPEFIPKWRVIASHLDSIDITTAVISMLALAIMLVWPRVSRRIPGPFVALIVTTVVARVFNLPVETIGTRFGAISASFPHPVVPHVTLDQLRGLVAPAFTIALLAAVESLLSAVVADGMIGGRHRSNMELVAQGIANIVSPLFGGIPATGAIARTATNVKNGGRTPVAGMVHALTLLLITLFFGRWAALIPLATLAAILVVVSYHMSEWRTFRGELTAPKSDVVVLLTTFALTVIIDLTVAIEVGMVLAAFLFMRRMAEVTNISVVTRELADEDGDDEGDPNAVRDRSVPDGVEVFEINGPFFFGAAEQFKDTLNEVARKPKVLIIRMRAVPAIDATGLHVLQELARRYRREGTLLLLSDVHAQPMFALVRSDILPEIGEENLFGNIDDALNRARDHLGLSRLPRPANATATVERETPTKNPQKFAQGS
ncbi:MAG: sodium-independent anion transporter [Gemmatimonadetes bacterium]|nr:MAG: sodium-independent anion transporter [Gemmatimonadota bacterium]